MNFLKYHDFKSLSTNRARPAVTEPNPTPNNIISNDPRNTLQAVYDSNADEMWIESWLAQNLIYPNAIPAVTTEKKPKFKHKIQISQAKEALKKSLSLVNHLSNLQKELESNVETMSSATWKKKTNEIGTIKDDLTKLMAKFENVEVVSRLKATIKRRKKKRLNQKKRKEFRQAQIVEQNEKCQKMHKEVDEWLNRMKEEAEKIKMEEHMTRDADCVLSEVTKKKSDARKQLSLIAALVKLRNVRERVATQRGEKTSLEDRNAFDIASEKLINMWGKCLRTYSTEEQGLRLMLEKTAKEDTQAARIAKEKKLIDEWKKCLFGPKFLTPVNNPVYWALTAAERDAETFIAIRKSWDTFLELPNSDSGSKIPIGWVLPDENPTSNWSDYLEH